MRFQGHTGKGRKAEDHHSDVRFLPQVHLPVLMGFSAQVSWHILRQGTSLSGHTFQKDQNLFKADLDAAAAKIPEIAKNWMQNKRNALSDLMSSYLRDKGYLKGVPITPEFDILQLAIAVFACSPIRSAKSPRHNPSSIPLIGPDAAVLHKCDHPMCRIVFSEVGFEAAMSFVKLVGLDPFSTTYADIHGQKGCSICSFGHARSCTPMDGCSRY